MDERRNNVAHPCSYSTTCCGVARVYIFREHYFITVWIKGKKPLTVTFFTHNLLEIELDGLEIGRAVRVLDFNIFFTGLRWP